MLQASRTTIINPMIPQSQVAVTSDEGNKDLRTFYGFVETKEDGLRLLAGCLNKYLKLTHRRLRRTEYPDYIRSGSVFVFKVEKSKIHRWTDDRSWTKSRIRGDFLEYRECEAPSEEQAGKEESGGNTQRLSPQLPFSDIFGAPLFVEDNGSCGQGGRHAGRTPRLSDPRVLENGLRKKTLRISYQDCDYRIVCYYNIDEVEKGKLTRPAWVPELQTLEVEPEQRKPILPPIQTTMLWDGSHLAGMNRFANDSFLPEYGQKRKRSIDTEDEPEIERRARRGLVYFS